MKQSRTKTIYQEKQDVRKIIHSKVTELIKQQKATDDILTIDVDNLELEILMKYAVPDKYPREFLEQYFINKGMIEYFEENKRNIRCHQQTSEK